MTIGWVCLKALLISIFASYVPHPWVMLFVWHHTEIILNRSGLVVFFGMGRINDGSPFIWLVRLWDNPETDDLCVHLVLHCMGIAPPLGMLVFPPLSSHQLFLDNFRMAQPTQWVPSSGHMIPSTVVRRHYFFI